MHSLSDVNAAGKKRLESVLIKPVNSSTPPLVTLYVVPGCPLCDDARSWLRQNNVDWQERDVANDFGALRAMHKLTRQRLVPVFEAKGRALVRPASDELAQFLG